MQQNDEINNKVFAMKLKQILYESIMAILALIVLAVLIIEFTRPLTEQQALLLAQIDILILIVFAVDYFYRLFRANNKATFIKHNVFDLIAILPFDKAFRVARLARLVRLTRLTRITKAARLMRIIVITRKFTGNLTGILKTNGLQYVLLLTTILILIGAISIYSLEASMTTFGDALWWSIVTATTVGYGDISPASTGGRVVAVILMFVGIGLIGMVTGSIATYFVSKIDQAKSKPKNVTDEQIEYVKNKLDTIDTLDRKDLSTLYKIIEGIWEERKNP